MGDLSVEPSMEDILSSIKRIIAEEGEATSPRQRRGAKAAPPPEPLVVEDGEDAAGVLELSDPIPPPAAEPAPAAPTPDEDLAVTAAQRAPEPPRPTGSGPADPPTNDPIVSPQAAAATRGSLDSLSRLLVKPEPSTDGTLEGLVREMLRPMLREWLDANLPAMVEGMVQREIAKITGAAS